MARPRQLPEIEKLVEMRVDGWRLIDIAEQYEVTASAVHYALKRADRLPDLVTYHDIVPWKIEETHQSSVVMRHIRAIARQQQGAELNDVDERRLSGWLDMLGDQQLVLDYHPQAPANDASRTGGFFYRTRVPEDQDFFRMPDINLMLAQA